MILLLFGCSGSTTVQHDSSTDDTAPDSAAPADCWDDDDGDGWGSDQARRCGPGATETPGDCDDADQSVSPDAPETCDGADNDCDGLVDDADDVVDGLPFWPDADGDGYGDEDGLVTACAYAEGLALEGGDCDDADPGVNPGADEACDGIDLDCDGYAPTGASGVAETCPAESCLAVLAADPGATDGLYWLTTPSGASVEIWCDQTTDGGGWTLGFLRNTASVGSQGDFGEGDVDVALLNQSTKAASISTTPTMAWLDLENFDWTELRLEAAYSDAVTYVSRAIPRSDLRISFGEDGYYLYGEGGYYWCGGDATYTDSGVGGTNNPDGAPTDCKGHGSLGSGWDFSESAYANQGLTLCGADGSYFLAGTWGGTWTYYGAAGAAQAIYVR